MEPLTRARSVRPGGTDPTARHFQGGDPPPGAICADCGQPLHLIWDLDATDPALTGDPGWAQVAPLLGGSERLPILFCFGCWDSAYRLDAGLVVPISQGGGSAGPDPMYPDRPAAYPRSPLALAELGGGGSQLGGSPPRMQERIERCDSAGADAMLELATVVDDGLPLFLPELHVGVAQLGVVACSACLAIQVYSESD